MDNLLILRRIIKKNRKPKVFNENEKCAIAIVGIHDKHLGIKPAIIECYSLWDLNEKLKNYLPTRVMPPFNILRGIIRERGYIELIKYEVNGCIRYRA